MKKAVLHFIMRSRIGVREILLARKKTGEIGVGKLSAPGGKLEPGETLRQACTRENYEEFRITIPNNTDMLIEVAVLDAFTATGNEPFTHFMRVFVYRGDAFSGEPIETNDMHKPFWVPVDQIPYPEMYAGDEVWMPHVFDEAKVPQHFEVYRRNDRLVKVLSKPLTPFSELMKT